MKSEELSDRFVEYACRILRLVRAMPKSFEGRHVAKQLFRSATATGANYEEACGAESREDFVHKLRVVLKELEECRWWLKIVRRAPLVSPANRLAPLLGETEELIRIVGKGVVTASSASRPHHRSGTAPSRVDRNQ